jgi:hypothetical protein
MAETIVKNETVAQTETPEEVKAYSFRKLSSEDIFLMMRILGKIGVKELKNCFEGESLEMVIASIDKNGLNDKALVGLGVAIGFDGVDIILNNLPKCDREIYQLLAQVAAGSVTEEQIKADAVLFMEMLVDFVKKEEFPAFFKVVSKLFK